MRKLYTVLHRNIQNYCTVRRDDFYFKSSVSIIINLYFTRKIFYVCEITAENKKFSSLLVYWHGNSMVLPFRCAEGMDGRKCLFNDALNTFYLRLYGVRPLSERGNLLPPHGLIFPINSKGSFICTIP